MSTEVGGGTLFERELGGAPLESGGDAVGLAIHEEFSVSSGAVVARADTRGVS